MVVATQPVQDEQLLSFERERGGKTDLFDFLRFCD